MGTAAALLTSFYSWRLMFLTFWGRPRWASSDHIRHAVAHGHDEPDEANPARQEDSGRAVTHAVPAGGDGTGGYHPHESPWTMLVPLGVLTLGAVFAGFAFKGAFIDDAAFWGGSIFYNAPLIHELHEVPLGVKLAATIAMLLGLVPAWYAYIRKPSLPGESARQLGPVYRLFLNKWYFDELYDMLFVRPAFIVGRWFWRAGRHRHHRPARPNGAAWVVSRGAVAAKQVQSGYLTSYALIMLLGLVAAVTWALA